jgi:hypothetical protein
MSLLYGLYGKNNPTTESSGRVFRNLPSYSGDLEFESRSEDQ